MSDHAQLRRLVDKLWSYCDVLRDAGVSSIDYVEQLSFLLFLKMADERAHNPLRPEQVLPPHLDISWNRLARLDGDALENEYRRILTELGKEPTNLGVVFRKAQNRVQEPALLRKLIVDLIGTETWSVGGDVNGDAYEALLERSATDIKSGAGQYFTPRPLVRTMGRGVAADTGRHHHRPGVRYRRLPALRDRSHPTRAQHGDDAAAALATERR